MKILVILLALIAGVAAASYVQPTPIWESNNIRGIEGAPFVPVKEQTNTYHDFKYVFITSEGEEIPAWIEGSQHDSLDNDLCEGNWGETRGITRSGTPWKGEYVMVYVAVEFTEACELKKAVITGPKDYRIEIDLDKFWGTPHKFKKGEKYGFGFYL